MNTISLQAFYPPTNQTIYLQASSDEVIGHTIQRILQIFQMSHEHIDYIAYEPFGFHQVQHILYSMYDSWEEWKQTVTTQWNETLHLVIHPINYDSFSYFQHEWTQRYRAFLQLMGTNQESVPQIQTTSAIETLANTALETLLTSIQSETAAIRNQTQQIQQETATIRNHTNLIQSFTQLLSQYPDAVSLEEEEILDVIPPSDQQHGHVQYFQFTIPMSELRNVMMEYTQQQQQEAEAEAEEEQEVQGPIYGYHHRINRRKRQTNLFPKREQTHDPVSTCIHSLEHALAETRRPSRISFANAGHSFLHALMNTFQQNEDDVKVVLTSKEFRELDTCVYDATKHSDLTCNVCLDGFKNEHCITKLPCQHSFHTPCIFKWLRESSTKCPVCRGRVAEGHVVDE